MSGGTGGVYRDPVNEFISLGLCPKDPREPWKVLSRGGIVSSLYLGRHF